MTSNATPGKNPEKILMIKLGAIGDLVMASPFFHQVRRGFPKSRLVLLVGRSCVQAVENNPHIDRLVVADDSGIFLGSLGARLLEAGRLLRLLRREKFDLVFVLHRGWQFNLLARLAGIPLRVGFARGREGMTLTRGVALEPSRNERETYLDLLRALGFAAECADDGFFTTDAERRAATRFLNEHSVAGQDVLLIAVAPGGGRNVKTFMPSKRWPLPNYIRLIGKIAAETSARIILCGSADERDLIAQIRTQYPACLDATHLSLGESAALLRQCGLFVGNDSAPLHIAAAMGVPTLAFYGPTNPLELAPPGPRNTVIHKQVECSPCYDQGRFPECHHLQCLRAISVDEAWSAVLAKLGAAR
jgi:lipopolysaccharide heptosyltransferase II